MTSQTTANAPATDLQALVTEIRSARAAKSPDIEAKLKKLSTLLPALRDTRSKAMLVASHYPSLAPVLAKISFDTPENALLKAQADCETARLRLRRSSLNIGVAGKGRQGKSQILQMLTGLGNAQIPTGDAGFCTAARSVVRNGAAQSATVHYLTEARLLEAKVYPSYSPIGSNEFALGLSPRPASISAFVSNDLPFVPDSAPVGAYENWKKVVALQADLRRTPALLARLGAPPEPIPLDAVRNYLVKDAGETTHQVVDFVELSTPFDSGLPDGMTVYDLPGLEDPTPGIREAMLKSVSEDADIVLLIRKPSNSGDDWQGSDHVIMNMLKAVYPYDEIQPRDWVLLVLNLDSRPGYYNAKNVEDMKAKAPSGFTPVVCDCGSKDAVRAMLAQNLRPLVEQAGHIDDIRIRKAEAAFDAAIAETSALYEALRNATSDVIAQESGFDFERHLLAFMAQLRDPFRRDVSPEFNEAVEEILASHITSASQKFEALYAEFQDSDVFPAEFPIFSKKRLKDEFGAAAGPSGPVEIAVRNQREALLKLLREELADCCRELVDSYFKSVVDVGFAPNPALSRIGNFSTAQPRERLTGFLAAIRRIGSFPSLEDALGGLLRFSLSFESSILPELYAMADLNDFNPDLRPDAADDTSELASVKDYIANGTQDSEARSNALFNWLRQKSELILYGITSGGSSGPMARMSAAIARTMLANYDAFVFRFIWGDATAGEWRRLADRSKAVFWKDEFEAAAASSQLARDWDSALKGLRDALA